MHSDARVVRTRILLTEQWRSNELPLDAPDFCQFRRLQQQRQQLDDKAKEEANKKAKAEAKEKAKEKSNARQHAEASPAEMTSTAAKPIGMADKTAKASEVPGPSNKGSKRKRAAPAAFAEQPAATSASAAEPPTLDPFVAPPPSSAFSLHDTNGEPQHLRARTASRRARTRMHHHLVPRVQNRAPRRCGGSRCWLAFEAALAERARASHPHPSRDQRPAQTPRHSSTNDHGHGGEPQPVTLVPARAAQSKARSKRSFCDVFGGEGDGRDDNCGDNGDSSGDGEDSGRRQRGGGTRLGGAGGGGQRSCSISPRADHPHLRRWSST